MSERGRVDKLGLGGHADVDVFRLDHDILRRSLLSLHFTADHPDLDAIFKRHLRDLGVLDVPIAGIHHLMGLWQVSPQLEAVHASFRVAFGHFLMDDAAAGGHPLDVAFVDHPLVAQAVSVFNLAAQHIGDGFDAAMGMPGEPPHVIYRVVAPEIIQKQEGVEHAHLTETKSSPEMNPGAFDRGFAFDHFADIPGLSHFNLLIYSDRSFHYHVSHYFA